MKPNPIFHSARLHFFLVLSFSSFTNLIAQEQWFPIGPAPIINAQTYGGSRIDASGRASVVVANPMNPKDVWLGTSNGGVWYSTNATEPGMNWKPMSDGFSSMAIGAIALANCDAERCNTIYVGTGENSIRRDTYYGSGMFKISWSGGEFPEYYLTPLGSTETLFFGGSVNNILLDGSNIYITLSEGRTSSGSQSTVIAPEPPIGYGIFHSADEGATWTRVGTQPDVLPTDLERRDNFLYAGFMGRGIYRYDLSAGNSGVWCPINPGVTLPAGCVSPGATGLPNPTIAAENFNHVEFEFAPSNPDIMYAMFGTSPEIRVQSARPLLYKSTNGGTNWSRINYTTSFQYGMQTYSYYTHTLAIHPTDANTIYVGGMKLNRSTDSGLTFQDVAPGQIHPDHHDLIFPDPTNADVIYNLDDGGFYYSFDGGSCWLSGNYDLQIAGFYSVSADIIQEPGQPATEFVHGGAQDNGTNLFIGGRVWKHTLDGDGGDGGVRDGNVFYASMQRRFSTDGKFYRSTSGGDLGSFSNIPGAVGGVSSFYPPFAQHQGTADIYTVTDRVYKSTFATNTWTQVSPEFDASPTIYPAIETENTISAFAVAPTNNNRIYVGLYNGAIWRSNGAPCMDFSCWTEIAGPNIGGDNLPDGTISSIDVHPGNENIIYLTYSAFNRPGGQVWLSVNGGTTWVSVSSGLPANLPMNVLKINPGNPQMLWLGSDRGVYRSMDGGSSWEHFGPNRGMPNVAVYDFAIDNSRGRVYAATHGRGMFVLTNSPVLHTFEGWMGGEIWDILVYGEGYTVPEGTPCTAEILLENGDVCAAGGVDSYGNAEIRVGADGNLVTNRQFVWEGRPVIAACLNSRCVGNTPISTCLADPNNKIATIKITCGLQTGFARVSEDCPQQANPPSTVFQLSPPLGNNPGSCAMPISATYDEPGSFDMIIAISTTSPANGGDRILCGTQVNYEAGDDAYDVAEKTRNAINESPQCQAANIVATTPFLYPTLLDTTAGEDFPVSMPLIQVTASGISGGQIVVSVRQPPAGNAECPCFELNNLGLSTLNQLSIMRTSFTTAAGGAQGGGHVLFTEISPIGTCEMVVPTLPGETGEQIAQKIADAMLNMTAPGTRKCEARQNPYDVKREGADLITIAPFGLRICSSDPKVGVTSGPDGLNLAGYQVDEGFKKYFALSLHSGIGFPLGSFSNNFKRGGLLELDGEFRFSKKWAIEGILGRYTFGAKAGTNLPDQRVSSGILNIKYYLKTNSWQPYLAGGAGLYFPDNQNTAFGLFAATGIMKNLNNHFQLDFSANIHFLFNAPSTSFFAIKSGIKYRF